MARQKKAEAFLNKTERSITQRGLDESATQLIPAFSPLWSRAVQRLVG